MANKKENKEHFAEFVRDLDEREPKPPRLRHEVINGIDFYTREDNAKTTKTANS